MKIFHGFPTKRERERASIQGLYCHVMFPHHQVRILSLVQPLCAYQLSKEIHYKPVSLYKETENGDIRIGYDKVIKLYNELNMRQNTSYIHSRPE